MHEILSPVRYDRGMGICVMLYGILGGLTAAVTVGFNGGGVGQVLLGYLTGATACGMAFCALLMLLRTVVRPALVRIS